MAAVYTRNPWLERMMHGAAYAVVVLMPSSVLYPLFEPLGPGVVELYVTPGIELADIPVGILLLLAAIDRVLARRHRAGPSRPGWFPGSLVTMLGLLGAASVLTALTPWLAVYTTVRWLLAAAVLWAMVQTRVPPRRLVYVLAFSLCVHAVIALLQGWSAGPLGLPGELTLNPDQPSAPVVRVGDEIWLRAFGMTFHPNVLGGYFAVALTLLLPLLSTRPGRLIWCVLLVGLAATLSRSAALALLLVIPAATWRLWRTTPAVRPELRRTATVVGITVLLAVVVVWKPVVVRLDPLLVQLGLTADGPVAAEEYSLLGRRQMNDLAVEIVSRHPFLGIGAGNFPTAMERADIGIRPQYVHNVPLLLAAEVGIGGGIVWLALTAWVTLLLLRRAPSPWLTAGVGAWWVLAIVGLFDCYPWSLNAGRLLTVTVLALIQIEASAESRS